MKYFTHQGFFSHTFVGAWGGGGGGKGLKIVNWEISFFFDESPVSVPETQKRKITFDVASTLLEERQGTESSNISVQETSDDSNDDKFKFESADKFKLDSDDKSKVLSSPEEPYQAQKV